MKPYAKLGLSLLIVGLGFAVRVRYLAHDSFWLDEMATVKTASLGWQALEGERDHPPLLYGLVALSSHAFGTNEFSARLPSLLAGTLALPLMMVLGKVLTRPVSTHIPALLLALSPIHLKYSQEARHYALLMLFSLASYLLLYQLIRKPNWKTAILFALITTLNLYTHYSAFIVLLTQAIWLVAYWLIADRRRPIPLYLAGTGLLTSLLYLPQLPRLIKAMQVNTTSRVLTLGDPAGFTDWTHQIYTTFGMGGTWRPALLLLATLLGFLWLAQTRRWKPLTLLLCALCLPVPLILLLDISREAFVRYVLYLLPFYLFPAGYLITQLTQHRPTHLLASLFAISLISHTPIQQEHTFILHDWRTLATDLQAAAPAGATAPAGTIIAPITLNLNNGFNLTAASLPYYLPDTPYTLLPSHTLLPQDLTTLDPTASLYVPLYNWHDQHPTTGQTTAYQTHLYLWQPDPAASGQPPTALTRLITAYQQLIPLADQPAPRCMLEQDLAALHIAQGDFIPAAQALRTARTLCPVTLQRTRPDHRPLLGQAIVNGLAPLAEAGDKIAAALLYNLDNKHPAGLTTLTHTTLATPTTTYTMPHNGDWGNIALAHPPHTYSHTLTLPTNPLILRTRLALDPQSWAWGSDGVTYLITLQTADGTTHQLLNQHILPGQAWHPVALPLADYAGQTITLTLHTTAGPAGDTTADWAGWQTPRLMWDIQP